MTILWPRDILPPQTPRPHYISPMNVSGPVSGAGLADVIAGDAGFWRASYGSIVVNTPQRVKVWRGIAAKLQGRLNPILVPYCRAYQPIAVTPGAAVPHSDGSTFSNGSGYVGSGTLVKLVSAVTVRAVSCTVDAIAVGTLEPGQVFSLGERLYQITNVEDLTGTQKRLSFMPPAREAVISGTELEFTRPVCRMRLASDDAMLIDLSLNRRGFPTLDFVEDLAP